MHIIRSKAPLRIGFAGGGTDLSPYCENFTGYVLNATIDMYAYCTIEVTNNNKIEFLAKDLSKHCVYESGWNLEPDGELDLFKNIYNRLVKEFIKKPLSFKMTTYSDVTYGSGLGGSSTMVVAILKAFEEWFNLPLGEYDIAHLAYLIERVDTGLLGGKQDQYAATFGGFNFMEFHKDKVIVNPLRIKNWILNELETSLVLCFTGVSRESAHIIEQQIASVKTNATDSLEHMHKLKNDAVEMKEALLKGDISGFASILDRSWRHKKSTSEGITNSRIDEIYYAAKEAGAIAGKVSGAGGGGFMMFIVDPNSRTQLISVLQEMKLLTVNAHFSKMGTQSWTLR